MDRINGRLPKDAIVNQAKLENKNVCCKFSLKFFSKLASTNNTPKKTVTKADDKKLWLSSLKNICTP